MNGLIDKLLVLMNRQIIHYNFPFAFYIRCFLFMNPNKNCFEKGLIIVLILKHRPSCSLPESRFSSRNIKLPDLMPIKLRK